MTLSSTLLLDHLKTPIGELSILADETGALHAVGFNSGHPRMQRALERGQPRRATNPGGVTDALQAYFDGEFQATARLSVVLDGTEFQRAVWTALRRIPCGETRSYGELARTIGRPSAVRAVGLANGANPVGIVIPCHRVIGSNGTLTGYGGGIERKRWLLTHEGIELKGTG